MSESVKDAKPMTDHFEGIDKLVKEAPHTDGAPNFRRVSDNCYKASQFHLYIRTNKRESLLTL